MRAWCPVAPSAAAARLRSCSGAACCTGSRPAALPPTPRLPGAACRSTSWTWTPPPGAARLVCLLSAAAFVSPRFSTLSTSGVVRREGRAGFTSQPCSAFRLPWGGETQCTPRGHTWPAGSGGSSAQLLEGLEAPAQARPPPSWPWPWREDHCRGLPPPGRPLPARTQHSEMNRENCHLRAP